MNENTAFKASSYLVFRHFIDRALHPGFASGASTGVGPADPGDRFLPDPVQVATEGEILEALRRIVEPIAGPGTGLLLSGGIDSAILASLLPPGTKAFTISFMAEGAADEYEGARAFADEYGLDLHRVEVSWEDCASKADFLMSRKGAPLHPVEAALFKASTVARGLGVKNLIVGNGADSNFGGLDRLLSRDWTAIDFMERYTFVKPGGVLKIPVSMWEIYRSFERDGVFDTLSFLSKIHGRGVTEAFENAISSGGCEMVEPYEHLALRGPLDIARIRRGESKYLLRSLFGQRFPGLIIPPKQAFSRPLDQWMETWAGPSHEAFSENIDITSFTGEQKWMIFCLDRYLTLDRQLNHGCQSNHGHHLTGPEEGTA